MKKIISLLFIITLISTACNNQDSSTQNESPVSEEQIINDENTSKTDDNSYIVEVNEASKAGTLEVEDDTLTLTNLDNSGAPALDIYLSPSSENVDGGINLGNIEGDEESLSYTLESNINLEDYSYLVIWCYEYDVVISTYTLK